MKVRVHTSKGLHIPKSLIEQAGLRGEVEIKVRDGAIVIGSAAKPRAHWADFSGRTAQARGNALCDAYPSVPSWDEDEWEW